MFQSAGLYKRIDQFLCLSKPDSYPNGWRTPPRCMEWSVMCKTINAQTFEQTFAKTLHTYLCPDLCEYGQECLGGTAEVTASPPNIGKWHGQAHDRPDAVDTVIPEKKKVLSFHKPTANKQRTTFVYDIVLACLHLSSYTAFLTKLSQRSFPGLRQLPHGSQCFTRSLARITPYFLPSKRYQTTPAVQKQNFELRAFVPNSRYIFVGMVILKLKTWHTYEMPLQHWVIQSLKEFETLPSETHRERCACVRKHQ